MKFILFFIAAMLGHALAASQGASSLRRKLASASGSAQSYYVYSLYLDSSCSNLYQQSTTYGVCLASTSTSTMNVYATDSGYVTQATKTWSASTTCAGDPTSTGAAASIGTSTSCVAYPSVSGIYVKGSAPSSEPAAYGFVTTTYPDDACSTSATSSAIISTTSGSCISVNSQSASYSVSGDTVTANSYAVASCSGTATPVTYTTGKCTAVTSGGSTTYVKYSFTTAPSGPNLKLLALLVLLVIPIGLGVVWYLRRQGKCGGKAPEPVPTSEAEAAAKTTDNEVALVPTGESAEEPKA